MTLREEMENHFSEDFFPATKVDICDYLTALYRNPPSQELTDLINNLEDDPNFKYNSIDEILPTKYIYPIYAQECNAFFYKIISPKEAIYIKYKEEEKDWLLIEFHTCEKNISRWSEIAQPITKKLFQEVFNKACKTLKIKVI